MKKLRCKDLGGPCEEEITGNSFEELGNNCKAHVMEQITNGDLAHTEAAVQMKSASPEEQQAMVAEFKRKYDAAPDM